MTTPFVIEKNVPLPDYLGTEPTPTPMLLTLRVMVPGDYSGAAY